MAQAAVMSDTETSSDAMDQLAINTIRTLAMDAVQKAESGHPGTPMALAPVGFTLWNKVLRATIRPIRNGRTATVSCSRSAMPRCCCTH